MNSLLNMRMIPILNNNDVVTPTEAEKKVCCVCVCVCVCWEGHLLLHKLLFAVRVIISSWSKLSVMVLVVCSLLAIMEAICT